MTENVRQQELLTRLCQLWQNESLQHPDDEFHRVLDELLSLTMPVEDELSTDVVTASCELSPIVLPSMSGSVEDEPATGTVSDSNHSLSVSSLSPTVRYQVELYYDDLEINCKDDSIVYRNKIIGQNLCQILGVEWNANFEEMCRRLSVRLKKKPKDKPSRWHWKDLYQRACQQHLKISRRPVKGYYQTYWDFKIAAEKHLVACKAFSKLLSDDTCLDKLAVEKHLVACKAFDDTRLDKLVIWDEIYYLMGYFMDCAAKYAYLKNMKWELPIGQIDWLEEENAGRIRNDGVSFSGEGIRLTGHETYKYLWEKLQSEYPGLRPLYGESPIALMKHWSTEIRYRPCPKDKHRLNDRLISDMLKCCDDIWRNTFNHYS